MNPESARTGLILDSSVVIERRSVLTVNLRDFSPIPGLSVVHF